MGIVKKTVCYSYILFYLWKKVFSGNKTFNQRLCANSKRTFLFKFLAFSCFFSFLKNLKKQISTSVWSAQHPNPGQNIQHFSQNTLIHNFVCHIFILSEKVSHQIKLWNVLMLLIITWGTNQKYECFQNHNRLHSNVPGRK